MSKPILVFSTAVTPYYLNACNTAIDIELDKYKTHLNRITFVYAHVTVFQILVRAMFILLYVVFIVIVTH